MGMAEYEEDTHGLDIASKAVDTVSVISSSSGGDDNTGYIGSSQDIDTTCNHVSDTTTTNYNYICDSNTFSSYTNTTLVRDTTDSHTSNTSTFQNVSNINGGDLSHVIDLTAGPTSPATSHNFTITDLHSYQHHISDKNDISNNNTKSYNYNYSTNTSNNESKVVNKYNVDNKNEGKDNKNIREESLPWRPMCSNASSFCRQMMAVLTVCGVGMALGTFSSFSAVAIPQWRSGPHDFTDDQAKWFASLPVLVSVPGCFFGGLICEALGPKQALTVLVPFVAQSWALIYLSTAYSHLLLARICQGLSLSVINVAIVIYPAEVSATQNRGIMIGLCECCIQFGVLLTYTLGLFLDPESIAFVFFSLLCVQLMTLLLTPESPLWLAKRGRLEEATQAAKSLRRKSLAADDLERLSLSSTKSKPRNGLLDQFKLLKQWKVLKPVLVAASLLISKELTGQYAMTAYSVQIFQLAGSSIDPYWCTFFLGWVRILCCAVCMTIIERFPRRMALCVGDLLTSGSLILISFYLISKEFGLVPEGGDSFGWVPFLGMILFIAFQGVLVSPVTWTLVAETLPNDVRILGGGIVTTIFCLFQFGVCITFPDIVKVLGSGWTYFCYACFSLLGALFVTCAVPETKGLSFVQRADVEKQSGKVTEEDNKDDRKEVPRLREKETCTISV